LFFGLAVLVTAFFGSRVTRLHSLSAVGYFANGL
jgi:hypothetical protein